MTTIVNTSMEEWLGDYQLTQELTTIVHPEPRSYSDCASSRQPPTDRSVAVLKYTRHRLRVSLRPHMGYGRRRVASLKGPRARIALATCPRSSRKTSAVRG